MTDLEELSKRWEQEGERLARVSISKVGVDIQRAPVAAACFTIAQGLRLLNIRASRKL
jgi:hypothetical protein